MRATPKNPRPLPNGLFEDATKALWALTPMGWVRVQLTFPSGP